VCPGEQAADEVARQLGGRDVVSDLADAGQVAAEVDGQNQVSGVSPVRRDGDGLDDTVGAQVAGSFHHEDRIVQGRGRADEPRPSAG
jgi:hypothetical protein